MRKSPDSIKNSNFTDVLSSTKLPVARGYLRVPALYPPVSTTTKPDLSARPSLNVSKNCYVWGLISRLVSVNLKAFTILTVFAIGPDMAITLLRTNAGSLPEDVKLSPRNPEKIRLQ